jgi:hypothetical protein
MAVSGKTPTKAHIGFGIFFLAAGLLILPMVIADPFDVTLRGLPVWILPAVLIPIGVGFLARGIVLALRRRRSTRG